MGGLPCRTSQVAGYVVRIPAAAPGGTLLLKTVSRALHQRLQGAGRTASGETASESPFRRA